MMRDVPVCGFNVTSPFKETIIPLLDDVDETARRVGAVNAVVVEDGKLKGFNTDVGGVKRAFPENGVMLSGKNAVVVGAGGAAKATVAALTSEGANVVIVNRTFKKAKHIAEIFACRAAPMEDLEKEMNETEILISCLPAGKHVVPAHALKQGLVILDANYGQTSMLVREGIHNGCTIIDGREWLLYQGLAVFTLFTGRKDPPVEVMRKSVYGKKTFSRSNIALVGFMGTGKSSVGRYVAEKLKLPLVDIDSELEKRNNTTVDEIFKKDGEDIFRKMEADEIERVAGLPGAVISCGGGAVLKMRNVDYLKEHCIVIWLWAGIETILKRTKGNDTRPLLKTKDKRLEIETLITFRNPYYAGASDLFIRTDYKKPEEIAERICYESAPFLKN
jgi:shikimate dehydrogenase